MMLALDSNSIRLEGELEGYAKVKEYLLLKIKGIADANIRSVLEEVLEVVTNLHDSLLASSSEQVHDFSESKVMILNYLVMQWVRGIPWVSSTQVGEAVNKSKTRVDFWAVPKLENMCSCGLVEKMGKPVVYRASNDGITLWWNLHKRGQLVGLLLAVKKRMIKEEILNGENAEETEDNKDE